MSIIIREAKVLKKENWGNYYRLYISAPAIARVAKPGQFIMIKVNQHFWPLLRRPFSLHDCSEDKIEIFFQVVGEGTRQLAAKKVGDSLDILGPLGKGFTLPEKANEKPLLLIAGGRGIAPFPFLAKELRHRGHRVIIFYGAKSKDDLPLIPEFKEQGFELHLSTDDGSLGFKGLITELVEKELINYKPCQVYACGPEAMLATMAKITQKWNLPAEFSLEARMGCGFGVCYGCVWPIRRGEKIEWTRICLEGPVFPADVIAWENLK